jgi:hypothetical protein
MGLTLGEGMGGMTQQRENWMKETIIEGCVLQTKSKLIHRIPFSGNTGSWALPYRNGTNYTRRDRKEAMDLSKAPYGRRMKLVARSFTQKTIKVHGGKLYGTYFAGTHRL